MRDNNFLFSMDIFEKLIISTGWNSLDDWIKFWEEKLLLLNLKKNLNNKFNEDWLWGLALPLLSDLSKLKEINSQKKICGISALPGTGKTTLGKLLETLSKVLNLNVSVVSIDDFYLPSIEMEKAIKNNPWRVSRGFPGSHSIKLLIDSLTNWKMTGELNVPVFDKSLRNGLGERSHWKRENPDIVVLEGWFLGIEPMDLLNSNDFNLRPELSSSESSYRKIIQRNILDYKDVWNLIDRTWQIKPEKFIYMQDWKIQQENEMFKDKGSALRNKELTSFLRMLYTSIPHDSFNKIKSDVLLTINQNRKLISIDLNNY